MHSVRGFPDYFVREDGIVFSAKRGALRVLRPWINSRGYPTVSLHRAGIRHACRVHRLIVETFIGPIPAGLTVNHRDGQKQNAALANLEVLSHGDNARHSFRVLGRRAPHAKLTHAQAAAIRTEYANGGVLQRELGHRYGVSQYAISQLCRHKSYKEAMP